MVPTTLSKRIVAFSKSRERVDVFYTRGAAAVLSQAHALNIPSVIVSINILQMYEHKFFYRYVLKSTINHEIVNNSGINDTAVISKYYVLRVTKHARGISGTERHILAREIGTECVSYLLISIRTTLGARQSVILKAAAKTICKQLHEFYS